MPRRVTIVMYHFVRDLHRSRYPAIKALDSDDFRSQLGYILANYDVIRMEDVLAARGDPDAELPDRALLLTFDDGYADHFRTVFPVLDELGLQGSFFPPARAVLERRMLDVNKIHFLLASVGDVGRLVEALDHRIDAARGELGLLPAAEYRERFARPGRWDPADVVYVKRMLQTGLPEPLRGTVVDELFRAFVAEDETVFADELYVTVEQLRSMRRNGMFVGGHGYDHLWLNTVGPDQREEEVTASRRFLERIGCDVGAWVMAYPYGGFDAHLQRRLEAHGCALAFTTVPDVADLGRDDPLALPRVDTNDLPLDGDAGPARGAGGST